MHHWRNDEVQILRDLYPIAPWEELTTKIHRTPVAIKQMAKKLGLRRAESFTRSKGSYLIRGEATDAEKGYLAGLIDADGFISISFKNQKSGNKTMFPIVAVANTNMSIINEAQRIMGNESSLHLNHGERKKPTFRVETRGIFDVLRTLKELRPYIKGKRQQCDLVIQWCESRMKNYSLPYSEEEWEILRKIRALNYHHSRNSTP
jgi:hypothetical protein